MDGIPAPRHRRSHRLSVSPVTPPVPGHYLLWSAPTSRVANDIVGPGVEVPRVRLVPPIAAAVAPMVDIHNLMGVCEAVEVRAERRMVPAWPATDVPVGDALHGRPGRAVQLSASSSVAPHLMTGRMPPGNSTARP